MIETYQRDLLFAVLLFDRLETWIIGRHFALGVRIKNEERKERGKNSKKTKQTATAATVMENIPQLPRPHFLHLRQPADPQS
jgi:hypothetical protein